MRWRAPPSDARPDGRRFRDAIGRPGRANVIAECKRRSPARGVLARVYAPADLARSYEGHGAAAISVLTEPTFFDGDARAPRGGQVRDAAPGASQGLHRRRLPDLRGLRGRGGCHPAHRGAAGPRVAAAVRPSRRGTRPGRAGRGALEPRTRRGAGRRRGHHRREQPRPAHARRGPARVRRARPGGASRRRHGGRERHPEPRRHRPPRRPWLSRLPDRRAPDDGGGPGRGAVEASRCGEMATAVSRAGGEA